MEERHARRSAGCQRVSRRRGAIAGHLLVWLSAATGATAAVVMQVQAGSPEGWLVPGLVVTLLLLVIGKMVSNERTLGRLDGMFTENSKRDDQQDATIKELWVEARGIEARLRETKHDAVGESTKVISPMELRIQTELDDLQERVRDIELAARGTKGV